MVNVHILHKPDDDIVLSWRTLVRMANLPDNVYTLSISTEPITGWAIYMDFQPTISFSKKTVALLKTLVQQQKPCWVARGRMAYFCQDHSQKNSIPETDILPLFSFTEDEYLEYVPKKFTFHSKIRPVCMTYLDNFKEFSHALKMVPYKLRATVEEAIGERKVFYAHIQPSTDVFQIIESIKALTDSNTRFVLTGHIADHELLENFVKHTSWKSRISIYREIKDDWKGRVYDSYYNLLTQKPLEFGLNIREGYPRVVQHHLINGDMGLLRQSLSYLSSELQVAIWLMLAAPKELPVEPEFFKHILAETNEQKIKNYGLFYGKFGQSYTAGLLKKVGPQACLMAASRMNRRGARLLLRDMSPDDKDLFIKLLGIHPFLFDKDERYLKDIPLHYRYFIQTYTDPYDHRPFYIKNAWKRLNAFLDQEELTETVTVKDLPAKLCIVNTTALSYHGKPCREIYEKRCRFLRKLCPDLFSNVLTNDSPKTDKQQKKIGFISQFLARHHSVFRDRHGVIEHLSKKAKVFVFVFAPPKAEVRYCFGDAEIVVLPNKNIEECSKILYEKELDALLFCELGLDSMTYFLAQRRFAPLQATTWGHSDTGGVLDTIDFFVSSEYFHPSTVDNEQKNFTEKLYLMKSLSTYYKNPSLGIPPIDRESLYKILNIPFTQDQFVWSCIQTNSKFSDTFWKTLMKLTSMFPHHLFLVLVEPDAPERDLPPNVHPMKRLPFVTYMRLISNVDVALDPFPFGGCNSSLEAFSFGVPVVTLPSGLLSGQFTHGFYRSMGMVDWAPIATDPDSYVEVAKRLADDTEFYERCSAAVRERSQEVLFYQENALRDWEEFFGIEEEDERVGLPVPLNSVLPSEAPPTL